MKFVSLLAASTLALTLTASSQTRWNASGSSLNWNDTGNRDSGIPSSTLMTYFDELYPAYTNGVKLVNNIDSAAFPGGHAGGRLAVGSDMQT